MFTELISIRMDLHGTVPHIVFIKSDSCKADSPADEKIVIEIAE